MCIYIYMFHSLFEQNMISQCPAVNPCYPAMPSMGSYPQFHFVVSCLCHGIRFLAQHRGKNEAQVALDDGAQLIEASLVAADCTEIGDTASSW